MLNSPGNHGHSLGLSVGATNLAGTRDGHTAVIRPAELTLHRHRGTGTGTGGTTTAPKV